MDGRLLVDVFTSGAGKVSAIHRPNTRPNQYRRDATTIFGTISEIDAVDIQIHFALCEADLSPKSCV